MGRIPEDIIEILENYRYEEGNTTRARLYSSGVKEWPHIPTLMNLWLEELKNAGLPQIDQHSGATPKRALNRELSTEPPEGDLRAVQLDGNSRQVAWLRMDGPRSQRGYTTIEVLSEPSRTDNALLAALTALEGRETDLEELRGLLPHFETPIDMPNAARKLAPVWIEQLGERARRETNETKRANLQFLHAIGSLAEQDPKGSVDVQLPEYAVALLRYYRPEFDERPHEEQLALIERACIQINEFLEALRKLAAFLEHGTPKGLPRKTVEDVQRDIKAAVLRDVEGMTYREIGTEFGIPPPSNFDYKGDHPTVRKMVSRGTRILEKAMGKDGWRKKVEQMRAEAARWSTLSEEQREFFGFVEYMAEAFGMPFEDMLLRYLENSGVPEALAEQEGITIEEARAQVKEAAAERAAWWQTNFEPSKSGNS